MLLKNHRKADEFAKHADFVIENITEILQIIERQAKDSGEVDASIPM